VKKAELDRLAVRQQMAIDGHQHQKIEEIKGNLKKNAMREIEEWKVTSKSKENKGKYIYLRMESIYEALTSVIIIFNVSYFTVNIHHRSSSISHNAYMCVKQNFVFFYKHLTHIKCLLH
jgi:hypothetical protein